MTFFVCFQIFFFFCLLVFCFWWDVYMCVSEKSIKSQLHPYFCLSPLPWSKQSPLSWVGGGVEVQEDPSVGRSPLTLYVWLQWIWYPQQTATAARHRQRTLGKTKGSSGSLFASQQRFWAERSWIYLSCRQNKTEVTEERSMSFSLSLSRPFFMWHHQMSLGPQGDGEIR